VIHQQTVGEHSARVAVIVVEIFGMPRAEVLYYALMHDAGEMWSGDVPYGAKRASSNYRQTSNEAERLGLKMLNVKMPELTVMEFAQVKIADLLEMAEFADVEIRMGNAYCMPVKQDTIGAAQKLAAEYDQSKIVNEWLHNHEMTR
jgi:5'-deoxynucleotidase YfbR-like HD superfamily hydrolase